MTLNFLPRIKNCLIGWYRRYKSSVFSRDIGMEVGLKECEVTVYIEEGEAEKDRGLIQLVNGETIKEVG